MTDDDLHWWCEAFLKFVDGRGTTWTPVELAQYARAFADEAVRQRRESIEARS